MVQVRPEGEIEFSPSRVLVLVGLNGSGKTSFFDFIEFGSSSKCGFHDHRLFLVSGDEIRLPGEPLDVQRFSPSEEVARIVPVLRGLESTFDQYAGDSLDNDDLELVNSILRASWGQISIAEVDCGDDSVAPLFTMRKGEVEVNSLSMSHGECVVLYLYWALFKKTRRPNLTLIDEPEAGLSPLSQSGLGDLFLRASDEFGKQIFISTHSPTIVSWAGAGNTLIIRSNPPSCWSPAESISVLEELGLDIPKKKLLLFEDAKALQMFRSVCLAAKSRIAQQCFLVHVQGAGNVKLIVDKLAGNPVLPVLGILDGDQRLRPEYQGGRYYFLPGDMGPENEAKSAIENHLDDYASMLGVDAGELRAVLGRLAGLGMHDFFEELSRQIFGVNDVRAFSAACSLWAKHYSGQPQLADFISSISQA